MNAQSPPIALRPSAPPPRPLASARLSSRSRTLRLTRRAGLSSLLAMLFRLPWRAVAAVGAGLALAGIATPNLKSVRDYVHAGDDGRRFLTAVDALPVDVRTRGPVTFLPLPDHDGVAEFLADYDISAALALRYHTGAPFPRAAMAVTATGFHGANGPAYQLVGRHLEPR